MRQEEAKEELIYGKMPYRQFSQKTFYLGKGQITTNYIFTRVHGGQIRPQVALLFALCIMILSKFCMKTEL